MSLLKLGGDKLNGKKKTLIKNHTEATHLIENKVGTYEGGASQVLLYGCLDFHRSYGNGESIT